MDTTGPIVENVFGIPWLSFDIANVIMIALISILVFVGCVLASRRLQLKPTGAQNVMEWAVDFVKGIISDTMDWRTGRVFLPLGLTLITYILVSNLIGVVTNIVVGDVSWWKAPTADAGITLALSTMVIVLTHFYAVKVKGFKEYGKDYFRPVAIMFPLKLIEEFTNTLTLGLRLFGNIFAGGVLTALIVGFGSDTIGGFLISIIPTIAWQAYSIFIGAIQAFIFTMLTMVYISQKVSEDH